MPEMEIREFLHNLQGALRDLEVGGKFSSLEFFSMIILMFLFVNRDFLYQQLL
jgi:hypothetical protein